MEFFSDARWKILFYMRCGWIHVKSDWTENQKTHKLGKNLNSCLGGETFSGHTDQSRFNSSSLDLNLDVIFLSLDLDLIFPSFGLGPDLIFESLQLGLDLVFEFFSVQYNLIFHGCNLTLHKPTSCKRQ